MKRSQIKEVVSLYVGLQDGERVVSDYDFRSPYYYDCALHKVIKNIEKITIGMFTDNDVIIDCYYIIDDNCIHENDLVAYCFK